MSQAVAPAQETAVRPTLFDRISYWARYGPPAVLLVAAVSRLVGLGYPPKLVFDETYYVKDAWTLIHLGYEGSWDADSAKQFGFTSKSAVDDAWNAGHVDWFSSSPSYIAHPPLGKWIIGAGELLAGGATNPYGWRLSVAIVGILGVALLMLVAHRMFQTPLVTTVAGGLFAIDNQAIVMSRVGLLDNMVMLFALAGFACMLEDRFWAERRLGAWLMRRRRGIGDWGPVLLWRPWLIGAGVAFGLCCAVKWSGIYFLAAFGLYALGSDLLLRRRAGVRFWHLAGVLKQGPVLVLSLIPPALLAYLAGWTGWFLTSGGYDRQYVESGNPRFTGFFAWVPVPIQNLWKWTTDIYAFHTGLDTPHPYSAPAALWPLIARPTSMWWDGNAGSCGDQSCVSAITDLPNPLIWYAAVAASIYLLVRFIRKREWQAALILMGFVGGYLPWLQYPDRTMFFFYSIAFEPYMLLALAATIGLMVVKPPATDSPDELVAMEASYGLRIRRVVVAVFVVAAVVLSVFFFPISAGIPVPYEFWRLHMWSPTWI